MIQEFKTKLLEIRPENHDTSSFIFEKPAEFEYRPGHFIMLAWKEGEKIITRAYSVASSPTEDKIRLIIKKKPGGFATKKLFDEAKKGEEITFRGPYGVFLLDEKNLEAIDNLIFFAGGVGIAPFMGMLRYLKDKNVNIKKKLFFSNKYKQDLLCSQELESYDAELIQTLTREEGDWEGRKGRIDKELIKENLSGKPIAYICGSITFINEIKQMLNELGIPKENVKLENFGTNV